MRHTHDLVAFLTLYDQVHHAPLSPAEREHVIRQAADAFVSCARPAVFEAAVRRLVENPVEATPPPPDPKPPVPGHPQGKVQPPKKGRVAR